MMVRFDGSEFHLDLRRQDWPIAKTELASALLRVRLTLLGQHLPFRHSFGPRTKNDLDSKYEAPSGNRLLRNDGFDGVNERCSDFRSTVFFFGSAYCGLVWPTDD